jgi:ABC-type antimicrobial peptide transport system permease subunit
VVLDLDFLTFKPEIVLENSILVILLTVVSFVIPMLKIYRIKPVKIIKTKE